MKFSRHKPIRKSAVVLVVLGLMIAAAMIHRRVNERGGLELAKTVSTLHYNTWTSFEFIKDPVMNDQFRWVLSQMLFSNADLGECLDVATRIKPGDEHSWFSEWSALGKRLETLAELQLKAGKSTSAAHSLLRSATYYRAALIHHSNPWDPRALEVTEIATRSFEKANRLLSVNVTRVEIPYEGTTLPAYYFESPLAKGKKAPLIIVHQGRDGWPEDTRWVYQTAMARGIHALMVHAPGQGLALRLRNLSFRPDWEKVITPIVDYALTLKSVDPKRIALMGLSFGGALVPRALAFEHRLRLAIVNPGVLNWGQSMYEHFESIPGVTYLYRNNPSAFNKFVGLMGKVWPTADWYFRDATAKHGVKTASELFTELGKFNNESIVHLIKTPLLIMEGTEEEASPGQSQKLFEALKSPKEVMVFDSSTTAQLHCQNGGLAYASDRLFDWIEDHL
jgi:hypothetical protein